MSNNPKLKFSNIRVLCHRNLISVRIDIGENELVVVGLNQTQLDWYLNKYVKSVNETKVYTRITEAKEIENILGISLDDLDGELSKILNENIDMGN